MINWTEIITIINFIMVIGIAIGGYISVNTGMSKTATQIQNQLREGLQEENALLQRRLDRLEFENKQLNLTILFIINALKKTYQLELEITNGIITIRDTSGSKVTLHQQPPVDP